MSKVNETVQERQAKLARAMSREGRRAEMDEYFRLCLLHGRYSDRACKALDDVKRADADASG